MQSVLVLLQRCYTIQNNFKGNAQQNELMRFHSLYPTDHGMQCESGEAFECLQHNVIQHTFLQLQQLSNRDDTEMKQHR